MNPPDPEDARWLTPDPLGGDIMNPQSLNRYAGACPERSRRVTNNPATFNDPLGLGDATACWMFNFLWPGCENIGASGGDNGTNPADPGSDPSFAGANMNANRKTADLKIRATRFATEKGTVAATCRFLPALSGKADSSATERPQNDGAAGGYWYMI